MDIVFFIYGLAFMAMGLVIVIRLEHESRLELLDILWLLATFAFIHGFLEWMDLWLLVRGHSAPLATARPPILLVSYMFLFEFGRRLVRISMPADPTAKRKLVQGLSGGWGYAPLLGGVLAGTALSDQPLVAMAIWSRYLFGFLGSALAGVGFHLYWRNCLAPVSHSWNLSQIRIASRLASGVFLVYALLGGLVVPRTDWFPASLVNQEAFFAWFGMPVQLLRATCAVLAAVSVGILLRIFHLEGLHRLRHALQTSEQNLADLRKRESMLSASPVVLYTCEATPPFRATYISPNIAELIGSTPELLAGHNDYWVEHIHPEERSKILERLPQLFAQGAHQNDFRFRIADGTYRWMHNEMRLFRDQGSEDSKIVGYVVDITERKNAERLAEQYHSVIAASPDGFWITDTSGRIIDANESVCRLLGYSRHELMRLSIGDIEAKESAEEIAARIREIMTTGHVQFEARHKRKDGASVNVEVSVLYAAAIGERFFAFIHDITPRKSAEAALRVAATAFESQEGMFITDAASVIVQVNQAFTEITGYTADEAIGQTPKLLSSGRHDTAFYDAMKDSIGITGRWQGEIWNRRKNGNVYPEWLTITAVKDRKGEVTHYVSTLTDITSRKAAEDEIRNLAFYDPLTRLPNRRLLLDRVKQALASSTRSGKYGALLYIDLDNFKTLNDTLGHGTGDLLLQQVAQRLVTCVREGDTVARLGGDEFVVMLEYLSDNARDAATQAEIVGEKILVSLSRTHQLAKHAHHCTCSIGVTLFGEHKDGIDEILKQADLAMYQAKAAGRNTLRFFEPEMQAAVMSRAALEADLHEAVRQQQFLLCYQVQVNGEGCPTGVEALVRWQHPDHGLVAPGKFIPLAEETGLILPLGRWVLETACTQLSRWAGRPGLKDLTMAVNVSARQFHQSDFVDQVLEALDHAGANPRLLKLELTESLLVDNVEDVIAKMTALKTKGVGFSLDDFGTGYSSLSYLKRLPLDQLKIDQGFVRNILTDTNDAAIAKMVVALAESMGLAVIAEGVEIEAQRDFLAGQGCLAYQGYLYSRPLQLEAFEEFAKRRQYPLPMHGADACSAPGS